MANTYPHAHEAIASVERVYDGVLLPDEAVATFRNIDRLFPSRIIAAGGKVRELPQAARQLSNLRFQAEGQDYDLYDFMALDCITGLLVLKDGAIAYETYQNGNMQATRWMSMSVAKSVTSTLVGLAIKDGAISSIDDPVVAYVPALKGSGYDGASVKDVLMMASGVRWNETYTDLASDRRALLKAQIAQTPGVAMKLLAGLPRAFEPGTVNKYNTGDTQVLGEIVRGAVRMPLSDYLSEKIWKPYGMEADATWWLDSPDGVEIGGSGIGATMRDFARFGLYFLGNGVIDGKPTLPDGWTRDASQPVTLKNGDKPPYGYMWWTGKTPEAVRDRAYAAEGIFGQNIYINPTRNVIVVTLGAQPKPIGKEPIEPAHFFDAVAAALD